MELTDVSEKRFERAMERLFAGSSTPAVSSAGGPSPAKKKKLDQPNTSGRAFQTPRDVDPSPVSHGCRPWDRGDLLRRLATYKSISWFGKPQVAGPVACARRGWVNVDIDLLACETCGSRLSFSVPPSWPRHQVELAALAFSEQLDTAHKGLCAWKNNPCADTLAFFPPTPVADLRGAYADRCESLLQLSALPVISETAKHQMRLSRGSQLDQLLSESNPTDPGFVHGNGVNSNPSENEFFAMNKGFYESQRMIALCGWEPRLLPYTVDYEDHSGAQDNERTGTSQGPAPSVTIHLKGDLQAKVPRSQIQADADSSDPASAVLDCNLCGASVGLWNFTTVNRPAPLLSSGFEEILLSEKKHLESGTLRSGVDELVDGPGLATSETADALHTKPIEVVPVNTLGRAANQKGVLDLKLTIAGGPRPTRLSAPFLVPPSPSNPALLNTGVQSKRNEAAAYAAASYESRRPDHQGETGYGGSNLETVLYDSSLPAGNMEGTSVNVRETGDLDGGLSSRNGKRKREVGSQWPGPPMKQPAIALPHASSVNAVDSRYLPKKENSMESVDNLPPESDGQCTNTAEYLGPMSGVLVEHSNGAVKSKADGGVEEGVRTNEVVIISGIGDSAGVGGLERVVLGGSSEAEIYDFGAHFDRAESVAEFATDGTDFMEEFVSGRGLMDDFAPEEAEAVDLKDNHRSSEQAVPGISHIFVEDTLSAGVSERCEGKGKQRVPDEDANAGSTIDTTNAIIQDHDADASLQIKEIAVGYITEESPVQRNEEVQSQSFFPPGLPLEDVRILEIQSRQFDPIRQHRHFCPWVNGHVAAATSSAGPDISCGWQIMLDALQAQRSGTGFAASEVAASKRKGDPLVSVRKYLGSVSTSPPPRI